LRFHTPVALFSVSVAPVLSSDPVTLTVPPVRVTVPMLAVVYEPPRLRVLALTLTVPALFQTELARNWKVPPLFASHVPFVRMLAAVPGVVTCWLLLPPLVLSNSRAVPLLLTLTLAPSASVRLLRMPTTPVTPNDPFMVTPSSVPAEAVKVLPVTATVPLVIV